ncbi:MAG: signal transduction protein [unclassified Hahellaceae]|nr:signal transduction protein [Hahellaceae bacterium]|tara:strand:+ start:39457 stop:43437 length:3981 start_codon:yes stop_codon:yes gene_type:complete
MQYQTTGGSERRASRRKSLNLAAKLVYQSSATLPCRIADFCADGLFIRYALAVGETLDARNFQVQDVVRLTFVDEASGETQHLSVSAVRIIDGAFGGLFVDTEPRVIQSLLSRYSAETRSGTQQQSGTSDQQASSQLVHKQLERILLAHVEAAVQHFDTALAPELDRQMSQAASDNLRGQFIDAATVLRQRGSQLRKTFIHHVIQGVRQQPVETASQPAAGELALVNKDEFEDWLTLKVMVTRAETQYRRALLELKMRLDASGVFRTGNETATGAGSGYNPLGPALICFSFHDALSELKLPIAVDRAVLKVFETTVVKALEPLYDQLNELLIRQGVLPKLDLRKYLAKEDKSVEEELASKRAMEAAKADHDKAEAQTSAASRKPARPGAAAVPRPTQLKMRSGRLQSLLPSTAHGPLDKSKMAAAMARSDETGATLQMHLQDAEASFGVIQELLGVLNRGKQVRADEQTIQRRRSSDRLQPEAPAEAAQEAEALPPFRDAEVFRKLASQQIAPDATLEVIPTLRERLKVDLGDGAPEKSLTPEQDNALDVVDRFFMSLLKNNKIEPRAKRQLRSLEVPILRQYMRQPDFFVQKDNPARQVINRIAQLGVKGNRAPAHQIHQIDQLVVRIQNEHEADQGVFADTLKDLDDLLAKQRNLYRRNVERVMAAAEGQEKVTSSKQRVSEEIERRLAGRRVPKAVISLLNNGWKDLLSLVYIRHDDQSEEWARYLGVIDSLLEFGDKGANASLDMPVLVKTIQEGLNTISSQHMPATSIRAELKAFLTGGSEQAQFVTVPESSEPAPGSSAADEVPNRSLQRWMQRIQKLKIGDWIRLSRDGEASEQVRIAWIGHNSSRYVFVNQMGSKVIDLDPLTLAAYLQQGICAIETEGEQPAVNESLANMVKDLYEQLSHVVATDELTGLIQRKEFERQAQIFCQSLQKSFNPGLILISTRQFYQVNEQVGIAGGDKALKDIVRICRTLLPEQSLLARYSGDEFIVAVAQDAAEQANRLLTALQSYRLSWEGDMLALRFVVSCLPLQPGMLDLSDHLRESEDLVRKAKSSGGQVPVQLSPRYATATETGPRLKGEPVDLSKLNIQLRCQKIIPLQANTQLPGIVEVLISVISPKGAVIPAAEFVQAAEQSDSIREIDRWVVGNMLTWMAENGGLIEEMGSVLINLSGHSLNDESLLEFIFEQLTAFECPLEKICFEITEASAISRLNDVADFITELKEYGCRFCLGHFGVGASAYEALKILPVDFIKIDGTFIRDLPKDLYDQMMLKSMVDMAHYHGSEVIAPYVEDKTTLDLLRDRHVDYAQGFFIERPKALPKFR